MTAEEMVNVMIEWMYELQMEKMVKANLIEDYPDIEEVLVGFQLIDDQQPKLE